MVHGRVWNLKRLALCIRSIFSRTASSGQNAPADILVDGVIGKAQIVLVGEARQTVGGGLMRNRSGRPSARPRAMTSSVVYIPRGEKAPALSP